MTARARPPLPSRLLVVTDRHQACQPLLELAEDLFAAGLRWLWLRDRDLPSDERRTLARALAAAAARHGATLTIGADVNLAAEVDASVHLRAAEHVASARQRLGAGALIGVSAHGLADLVAARDAGADYATLSPIFSSASKPGYGPAWGLSALREAAVIGLPIFALGGVTAETACSCAAAGAAGVAVMGAAMREGGAAVQALSGSVRESSR